MKKINWNSTVKVKLTDFGREIYYHQYDEFNLRAIGRGTSLLEPMYPKVDDNGFTDFQLWKFMQLYGRHIGMAMPNVCEELNFYIDDDLQEVKENDKI